MCGLTLLAIVGISAGIGGWVLEKKYGDTPAPAPFVNPPFGDPAYAKEKWRVVNEKEHATDHLPPNFAASLEGGTLQRIITYLKRTLLPAMSKYLDEKISIEPIDCSKQTCNADTNPYVAEVGYPKSGNWFKGVINKLIRAGVDAKVAIGGFSVSADDVSVEFRTRSSGKPGTSLQIRLTKLSAKLNDFSASAGCYVSVLPQIDLGLSVEAEVGLQYIDVEVDVDVTPDGKTLQLSMPSGADAIDLGFLTATLKPKLNWNLVQVVVSAIVSAFANTLASIVTVTLNALVKTHLLDFIVKEVLGGSTGVVTGLTLPPQLSVPLPACGAGYTMVKDVGLVLRPDLCKNVVNTIDAQVLLGQVTPVHRNLNVQGTLGLGVTMGKMMTSNDGFLFPEGAATIVLPGLTEIENKTGLTVVADLLKKLFSIRRLTNDTTGTVADVSKVPDPVSYYPPQNNNLAAVKPKQPAGNRLFAVELVTSLVQDAVLSAHRAIPIFNNPSSFPLPIVKDFLDKMNSDYLALLFPTIWASHPNQKIGFTINLSPPVVRTVDYVPPPPPKPSTARRSQEQAQVREEPTIYSGCSADTCPPGVKPALTTFGAASSAPDGTAFSLSLAAQATVFIDAPSSKLTGQCANVWIIVYFVLIVLLPIVGYCFCCCSISVSEGTCCAFLFPACYVCDQLSKLKQADFRVCLCQSKGSICFYAGGILLLLVIAPAVLLSECRDTAKQDLAKWHDARPPKLNWDGTIDAVDTAQIKDTITPVLAVGFNLTILTSKFSYDKATNAFALELTDVSAADVELVGVYQGIVPSKELLNEATDWAKAKVKDYIPNFVKGVVVPLVNRQLKTVFENLEFGDVPRKPTAPIQIDLFGDNCLGIQITALDLLTTDTQINGEGGVKIAVKGAKCKTLENDISWVNDAEGVERREL